MEESKSAAPGRGALAEFKEAVGNLFDQVLGMTPDLGIRKVFPRYELRVEDDGYRARVELPGMTREQIEVSLSGRMLSVSGERQRTQTPEGARQLRTERRAGKFDLSVRLPADVDPLAVVAQMRDGVLEVKLPKPGSRGRNIDIREAEEGGRESRSRDDVEVKWPWESSPRSEGSEGGS